MIGALPRVAIAELTREAIGLRLGVQNRNLTASMQSFLQRLGQNRKLEAHRQPRGAWLVVGGIIALLLCGLIDSSAAAAMAMPVLGFMLLLAIVTSVVAEFLRLFVR